MSCYNLRKGFRNNNFQTLTSFCLLGLVKWGFWLELPSHIKWSDKVCSKRNFLYDQHFFHDYHFKAICDQVFLSVEMFTLTFASQIHMPCPPKVKYEKKTIPGNFDSLLQLIKNNPNALFFARAAFDQRIFFFLSSIVSRLEVVFGKSRRNPHTILF